MTEYLREALNRSNPNGMGIILHNTALGDMLAQRTIRTLRGAVPHVADAILEGAVSVDRIRLPEYCKASRIHSAFARTTSAAGTLGIMAHTALNTVPAGNDIAIAPNGDIVFLAASGYTLVDVEYEPVVGKVVELTGMPIDPATGICALPPPVVAMHPHMLLEATTTGGAVKGQCTVAYRSAIAPLATLFANLNLVGDQVRFLVADAVTSCNLKLLVDADVADPQGLLTSVNTANV